MAARSGPTDPFRPAPCAVNAAWAHQKVSVTAWDDDRVTDEQSNTADEADAETPAEGEVVYSQFGIERDKRKAELEAMPGFRLKVDLERSGVPGT